MAVSSSDDEPWRLLRVGDVAVVNPPKPKYDGLRDESPVGFVPMAAVDERGGIVTSVEARALKDVRGKSYRTFAPGDVLFAKITPCMENGKCAVAPSLPNNQGFGSTEFHVLRPTEEVEPRYLWRYLRQPSFRAEAEHHMTGSVGQLRVPPEFLREFELSVPPIEVQRRTTAVLDQVETHRDAATAHLSRARQILSDFRQAVLAAACSGRLTEDWRAEHPNEVDAGPLLTDVGRLRASALRRAPHGPADERFTDDMPEFWAHVSLDAITSRITSGSRDWSRYYGRGSGTFIMAQNVRPGVMDWSSRQPVDPPVGDASRERSQIRKGDLLVTIVGANTGDVAPILEERPEHFVCQSVALMRPVLSECSAYLNLWFNSPVHGQQYFEDCMYGAGRPHLSFDQLRAAPIAVPPVAEQREIVHRVDALLSGGAQVQEQIEVATKLLDRTGHATVAKAFRGELLGEVEA